jgi:cobalt/nickel transport protein
MRKGTKYSFIGLATAAVVAALLSPFASTSPDGLEKVAETQGFAAKATVIIKTLIPDYLMPGISNKAVATAAAALVGTIATFGIVYAAAKALVAYKKRGESH